MVVKICVCPGDERVCACGGEDGELLGRSQNMIEGGGERGHPVRWRFFRQTKTYHQLRAVFGHIHIRLPFAYSSTNNAAASIFT